MDAATTIPGAFAVGLAGFLLLWPLSLWRRDASMVDFWWGPGIGVMAVAVWIGTPAPSVHAQVLLAILLVWSIRLGLQLGLRRVREGGEDPRYTALRDAHDPGFWWKSLFLVFLLQGILQGLVAAGALVAIAVPAVGFGPLGWIGVGMAVTGIAVETVADLQLDRFRAKTPHGGLLRSGLRAHVRYPHYTGEMLVWVGASMIAFSAGVWWAPVSGALMCLIIGKLSGVPILDARLAQTRPGFAAYRAEVPALLPRLRRPSGAAGTDSSPARRNV